MLSTRSSPAFGVALALILAGPAGAATIVATDETESTSERAEQGDTKTPSSRRRAAGSPLQQPDQSPVFVTGNPLGDSEMISPVTTLSGDSLTVRGAQSLGETLNALPGISTTSYGPMVGRPIIRGMDGDRIRILQNGVAALDASSLSFDHAVPQDPLSIERIEIIRGPAALLYGGNAIGGVVNTFDNRVPRTAIHGITGVTDVNFTTGNQARAGAAQIEVGNGKLNFHADVFTRKAGEQRIPGQARSAAQRASDPATQAQPYGTLPNSDGQWSGGSFGGSVTWADGYAGLAYNGYQSHYGSVAEPGVRLRMRQDRLAWASEFRHLAGPFTRVKFDLAATDYLHREIDGGREHGVFKNRGYEGRLEARHRRVGPFDGALGIQFGQSTFSTTGDHAMVPTTRTTHVALFALEEWQATERLKMSLGGRLERVALSPSGSADKRFSGAQGRAFTNGSLSLGGLYQLAPAWSIASSLAYSERAPTFYEIYADGPHDATGQYLRGNANAKKEKSISTDLALRFASGPDKGSIGVFYSRFSNYLAEYSTGHRVSDGHGHDHGHDHDAHDHHDHDHDHAHDHVHASDHDHKSLAEAVYRGVRAEFYGVEASATKRVFSRGPHQVDVDLGADYTEARNADTGEPIPRISPLRLSFSAAYTYGRFGARATVIHARGQSRVPKHDTVTAGYTTVGLALTYRFHVGNTQWLAYLRGDNLTNQTVRYASSVVRNVAPQMGRSATLGLRTTF